MSQNEELRFAFHINFYKRCNFTKYRYKIDKHFLLYSVLHSRFNELISEAWNADVLLSRYSVATNKLFEKVNILTGAHLTLIVIIIEYDSVCLSVHILRTFE